MSTIADAIDRLLRAADAYRGCADREEQAIFDFERARARGEDIAFFAAVASTTQSHRWQAQDELTDAAADLVATQPTRKERTP